MLVNSSPPSAAYMRRWTGSAAFVQIMACRLCDTKPLSKSMLGYSQMGLRNKRQWNFNQNTKLSIHENASENIVCEKAVIFVQGDELIVVSISGLSPTSFPLLVLNSILTKMRRYGVIHLYCYFQFDRPSKYESLCLFLTSQIFAQPVNVSNLIYGHRFTFCTYDWQADKVYASIGTGVLCLFFFLVTLLHLVDSFHWLT